VDELATVGIVEGIGKLDHDLLYRGALHQAALCRKDDELLLQCRPRLQLLDNKAVILVLSIIIHLHDIGVSQAGEYPSLVAETLSKTGLLLCKGVAHLERNITL
jgi:hypothetical protein